jgi:hypothetical protein
MNKIPSNILILMPVGIPSVLSFAVGTVISSQKRFARHNLIAIIL